MARVRIEANDLRQATALCQALAGMGVRNLVAGEGGRWEVVLCSELARERLLPRVLLVVRSWARDCGTRWSVVRVDGATRVATSSLRLVETAES